MAACGTRGRIVLSTALGRPRSVGPRSAHDGPCRRYGGGLVGIFHQCLVGLSLVSGWRMVWNWSLLDHPVVGVKYSNLPAPRNSATKVSPRIEYGHVLGDLHLSGGGSVSVCGLRRSIQWGFLEPRRTGIRQLVVWMCCFHYCLGPQLESDHDLSTMAIFAHWQSLLAACHNDSHHCIARMGRLRDCHCGRCGQNILCGCGGSQSNLLFLVSYHCL
mmetsp:Transcript_16796/g.46137  ORF Transcript_16796/g.46137 Transcript_16796/m.46137 type:complete len:216 (+) Transcript_16796:461-1108(+)